MNQDKHPGTFILLLCLLPGAGYLMLFFGLPLVRVIVGSFTSADRAATGFTLENWIALFTNPVYMDGIVYSIWLALAPTALSLAVALPLSALMQANETSRRLFGTLYRIPLVVPGIVAGFLVLIILDRGGMLTRLLAPFGVMPPRLVRDSWSIGAIIALSWKNIPFMVLIISGAMAAISKDVILAARTLGARRFVILRRIQLPLASAGITAATLLAFIGSLGSFVIPQLLGPNYPQPLSIHMYNQGFRLANWPMVYAMGTFLSIVAMVILLAYYVAIGAMNRQTVSGKG